MSLHFSQVLLPEHVVLSLEAADRKEALDRLLPLWQGDARVLSFDKLAHAVRMRGAPAICSHGFGLCVAHGRTDAVSSLIMAAARLAHPLPLEPEEGKGSLRVIFLAGIPSALNTEYLRLVGAIARICSDPQAAQHLLNAKTPEKFITILERELNPL